MVDDSGRIVATAPEHVLTAVRLPFDYISETTFYTRYGDWFAWLCLAAGLALVIHSWIPRHRRD